MRFEFTVRSGGKDCDVAVDTPSAVRLDEVRSRLLAAVGARADAPLHVARPDRAESDVEGELRTGSVLTVDAAPPTAPAACRDHAMTVQVIGGRDAGSTHPLSPGPTTIGRGRHCRIVLRDDAVSREHATLVAGPTGVTLLDRGSTNGTAVEGTPVVRTGTTVEPGDVLRIGDTLLTLRDGGDAPATVVHHGDRRLVVPARPAAPFPRDVVVEIAPPPPRPRPRPTQWLAALLPAVAGGALACLTHSPVFLLFALLSPLLILGTALGDRWGGRRSRRRSLPGYLRQHALDEQAVRAALHAETAQRRSRFPDPAAVADMAAGPTARLWERRASDPDVLRVRLGSADLPSHTRVRCDGDLRPPTVLPDLPVVLDLRDGPLGLVGPPGAVAGSARSLVAQLAALHPPSVVRMAVLLGDPSRAPAWSWVRWLPHLDGLVATTAVQQRRLVADLTSGVPDESGPWTVLMVDAVNGATIDVDPTVPGARLTAIVLAGSSAALPGWCTRVVDVSRPETAAALAGAGAPPRRVVLDEVREQWAEDVARALAPLAEAAPSGSAALPRSCHLLDANGIADPSVDELVARWDADDGRAATVLAIGPGGPVEIDLARDGPHALVAGTTGSGKSQLLRSLVLGLALAHPPDALSFVLVDFKGGAAFADCSPLPHVVGSVTDLDPLLTRRALHSLEAELRRRERLFAAAGAADLDAYRRSRPSRPVARLVIVVDEFAALADELPDFLHGVVSVAQRGRSLGVHLVLATQRPGSAVTAEIRANTALRIALRVVDAAESHEIVGVPDAAAIAPDLPGRAVMRVGESVVAVQTACVESPARSRSGDLQVERLGPWRDRIGVDHPPGSDATRVGGLVRAAAGRRGAGPPDGPWLPPLPKAVHADTLAGAGPGRVGIGMVDLPAEQRQPVLEVDLARPESWLLVGAARSGRTTALASLALGAAGTHDPSEIEIYVLDGGGDLAGALAVLPHVASCLGPDELHCAPALLRRLTAREPPPVRTLVLLDHGERLLAGEDDLPVVSAASLAELRRRSGAVVLVAGSRALLSTRVAGGFDHRLLLRLPDRADYSLAGLAPRDVPRSLPAGRALRGSDGAEVQLAHRGRSPDLAAAADLAHDLARRCAGRPSVTAIRVAPLPRAVQLADLPAPSGRLRLGRVGDAATPLAFDPFAGTRRWLVAGPARSGRTTTLLTLLAEARRTALPVLVAAPHRSPLHAAAIRSGLVPLVPASVPDGSPPRGPTLVLVDDVETFTGTACGDRLADWADDLAGPCSFVVAGRAEELAASYLGPGASVRRARSGLLLRPGPLDGELFGVRLTRTDGLPPGRGLLIGEPTWLEPGQEGSSPVPIQVAEP